MVEARWRQESPADHFAELDAVRDEIERLSRDLEEAKRGQAAAEQVR